MAAAGPRPRRARCAARASARRGAVAATIGGSTLGWAYAKLARIWLLAPWLAAGAARAWPCSRPRATRAGDLVRCGGMLIVEQIGCGLTLARAQLTRHAVASATLGMANLRSLDEKYSLSSRAAAAASQVVGTVQSAMADGAGRAPSRMTAPRAARPRAAALARPARSPPPAAAAPSQERTPPPSREAACAAARAATTCARAGPGSRSSAATAARRRALAGREAAGLAFTA